MSLALSTKEQQMLAAVIQEMGEIPSVDFTKIAGITGQKHPKNARAAFKRVWEKLKSNNGGESIQIAGSGEEAAGSGGEQANVNVPKVKAKAAPRKRVGQRKAPGPAAGPGRRSKRPTKKERMATAALKAEATAKIEHEYDDDADGEGDTTGITAAGDEDGGSESEVKAQASHTGSAGVYQENRDSDEISATLLGITVEEFRSGAGDEDYGQDYVKTPNGYFGSDDEV